MTNTSLLLGGTYSLSFALLSLVHPFVFSLQAVSKTSKNKPPKPSKKKKKKKKASFQRSFFFFLSFSPSRE